MKKIILSIFVLAAIMLQSNALNAQDGFFHGNDAPRNINENGMSYNDMTLSGGYGFSFGLFDETVGNGFSFNNFNGGSSDGGFNFGNFDYSTDAVPVGNGILLLSCAGIFYAQMKRNRKETKNK